MLKIICIWTLTLSVVLSTFFEQRVCSFSFGNPEDSNYFSTHISSTSGNLATPFSFYFEGGVANPWGSGGPRPLNFCLSDELGLKCNFFWGAGASYDWKLRNYYGVKISADFLKFHFSGHGSALYYAHDWDNNVEYYVYPNDKLSSCNNASLTALNADIDLAVLGMPFLNYIRFQWVNFLSDYSVTNETLDWNLSGKVSSNLLAFGGKIQFLFPFQKMISLGTSNFIKAPKFSLIGTIGRGKNELYYYWEACAEAGSFPVSFPLMANPMSTSIEAGVSMWHIPHGPDSAKIDDSDLGHTNLIAFSLAIKAAF